MCCVTSLLCVPPYRYVRTRALVAAEWINLILKWICNGERPYWWHPSSPLTSPCPTLAQFAITCETGPGTPSGHAMVTSCVWVTMCLGILMEAGLAKRLALKTFADKNVSKFAPPYWTRLASPIVLWSIVATVVGAVCVSRVYIAAHFPHQVIGGALIGTLLAHVLMKGNSIVDTRNSYSYYYYYHYYYYVGLAISTAVAAYAIYAILSTLGFEPGASIYKAQRGCVNPSWISVSTTPFYTVWRDAGACVGLAIEVAWQGVDGAYCNNFQSHSTHNRPKTNALASVNASEGGGAGVHSGQRAQNVKTAITGILGTLAALAASAGAFDIGTILFAQFMSSYNSPYFRYGDAFCRAVAVPLTCVAIARWTRKF